MPERQICGTQQGILPRAIQLIMKLPTMEMLIKFFDEIEDFVVATAMRLQRKLSRKAPERRHAPRTPVSPNPSSAAKKSGEN